MKAIIPTKLKQRISDKWGAGYYQAPRGDRTHNGIDYECPPGSTVLCPIDGLVTKLGYAYSDDLSFRYIQISTENGYDYRVFYVSPLVLEGDKVLKDMPIGFSQNLDDRYPEITPHIHLEIKYKGSFINPENISGKI